MSDNNHQHNMKRVGIFHEYNYLSSIDNEPIYMQWYHEVCDCGYERYYSKKASNAQPEKVDRYEEVKKK